MLTRILQRKSDTSCQVHGHHTSGNRMLAAMLAISLGFICWHVWTQGQAGNMAADPASFLARLGTELSSLLFSRKGVAAELWEVFPYFLAGIFIAGYIRTYKLAVKLQMKLRKHGVASVFLASFVGIITPLCACGTLTTAISLLFAGVPLAPVMALMVTSPLLSPSTYLITLNDLGPEWTVIRTVSAYAMGVFAGLVTWYVSRRDGFKSRDIFVEGGIVRGDFHDEDYPDERLRCSCRRNFGNRVAVKTSNKFLIFLAKSSEMLWAVGKYVIVGVFIGAVVERYLPGEWIYRFFGQGDPLNAVWVTLGSVPLFLHQISASSVLSHIKDSLGGTMDNTAALAFMIGGPVTAVPTMVMFWSFFRKRVFALYMFVCLSGTLLVAYTFRLLLFVPGVDLGNPLLKGVGTLSGGRAAVIMKHDPRIRMVMDPANRGLVATYSNELDGRGNVVFDTLSERFRDAGLNRHDNRSYAANAASWLDRGAEPHGRRILLYDLSPASGALTELSRLLGENGYRVTVLNRRTLPDITDGLLASCDQLWLVDGVDTHAVFSAGELARLEGFNSRGKGILIAASSRGDMNTGAMQLDSLARLFGVSFSGSSETEAALRVSTASNLINRASELLGRALKIVRKA